MNTATQTIINASAHEIPLPDGFVHCVVTSPPYYSLRSYAGEQQVTWPPVSYSPMPGLPAVEVPAMTAPLGLEPSPEAYIGHLVACFREVKRVMREDGVCWIVMGDSYHTTPTGTFTTASTLHGFGTSERYTETVLTQYARKARPQINSLQQGDLMGIPHRLMFALQGDGWICRNDPTWHKVAPMPESVSGHRWERCKVKVQPGRPPANQAHLPDNGQRPGGNRGNQWGDVQNQPNAVWEDCPGCDKCEKHGGYVLKRGSWRHTRAHETVLMCVKQMQYWADQERVREASTGQTGAAADFKRETKDHLLPGQAAIQHRMNREPTSDNGTRNPRSVLTADLLEELWGMFLEWLAGHHNDNPPDVLSPSPESYGRAHYAVFPSSLIAPLLRATAPTRVCPVCGAAWAPVVERTDQPATSHKGSYFDRGKTGDNGLGRVQEGERYQTAVKGHRPTCTCPDHDPVPGTVLDNFVGSGTTLKVCRELGVHGIGLDISAVYLDDHAKVRAHIGTPSKALDDLPLFAGVEL